MSMFLRFLLLGMLGFTPHRAETKPLLTALRIGNYLWHGLHNKWYGLTPLHIASLNNDLHGIMVHVARGANLNARDSYQQTPLHCAAMVGSRAAIRLLTSFTHGNIDLEAKNFGGWTPLHTAAIREDARTVKLLLALGADKIAEDDLGLTPFYYAADAQGASSPVVDLLAQDKNT